MRALERPAVIFLVAIFAMAAITITREFYAHNSFGLDYRVFRFAARAPLSEIYLPHPTAPFVYPPTAIAFFKPLGLLPVTIGYALWTLLSCAVFLFANQSLDRKALLLVVVSPVFLKALYLGQSPIIIGSLVILACLHRGMGGGLLLGLAAAVKPQLVILAPLALIVRRDWQGLYGFVAAWALAFDFALVVYGVSPWDNWLAAVPAFKETLVNGDLLWIMVTPAGVAENWGLPGLPFLLAGVGLGVAAVIRSANRVEGYELAALITVASVVSVPYAVAHDLMAALPFMAIVMFRDRFSVRVVAAILVLTMGYAAIGIVLLAALWALRKADRLDLEASSPGRESLGSVVNPS